MPLFCHDRLTVIASASWPSPISVSSVEKATSVTPAAGGTGVEVRVDVKAGGTFVAVNGTEGAVGGTGVAVNVDVMVGGTWFGGMSGPLFLAQPHAISEIKRSDGIIGFLSIYI